MVLFGTNIQTSVENKRTYTTLILVHNTLNDTNKTNKCKERKFREKKLMGSGRVEQTHGICQSYKT